jgi:hypothetical protein
MKPFFNCSPTAGSQLGIKRSEGYKFKLSASCKGKTAWNKGKKGFKYSEEFKKKRSEYMKGNNLVKGKTWTWTEEQKSKISKDNNHNYGKKFPFKSRPKRKTD